MTIQNIIFDWDGTLARTLELWLKGYQQALEKRDLKFEPNEIAAEFFHNHHEVPDRHPNIGFPKIAEETRDYVLQALQKVELYPRAIDTLALLKGSGMSFGFVSSSARRLLNAGLKAHKIDAFFPSIVAGDDGFGHKPDTLPFEETLNRIGANASETLVIGDSHVDILAGKSLGCKTCLFAPSTNALFHDFKHLRSLESDIEIDHLTKLLRHV